jgi:isopentenyl-diphosphate delta-isomerase
LPEINLDEVDLSATFLGRRLRAPLLISSMTGGPAKAASINLRLAEAAQYHGIALAVGSQRIALERGRAAGFDKSLRRAAPGIPIYANFGAAQLGLGFGLAEAERAIEMIEADALIVHLNPLQEAVQDGGDICWRGLLDRIGDLANSLSAPLIVKEVGFGISASVGRQLQERGVAAVDVAGAGGTNWALIEAGRATSSRLRSIGQAFADWGIPTARALHDVRQACPELPIIGSGGIRDGVEVAKALRLGANLVGIAAGLLAPAMESAKAVEDQISAVIAQLRICCLCTGSRTLTELCKAPLL